MTKAQGRLGVQRRRVRRVGVGAGLELMVEVLGEDPVRVRGWGEGCGGGVGVWAEVAGGFLAEDLLGVGEEPDDGEEGEGEGAGEEFVEGAVAVAAEHVGEESEGGVQWIRSGRR